MLVPIDLNHPNKKISGYLYPNIFENKISSLLEIQSDKEWQYGVVVYIGQEISKNDIFARVVDSGKKIESVEKLLKGL